MRNSVLIFDAIAKISLAGLALCLLVSCGHGKHVAGVGADGDSHASDGGISTSVNDSADSAKTADPELLASLKDELIRQLTELHGDYSKVTSSAPSGDSGRVTDLAYDTDTHTLSWSYANLADYDGNGEVGVPDITPIANNFLANTTDGTGNDALESWIDGDKNGEVGVSDVTPIANNYLARIDGYRVYRKAPGETEFLLLPDPDDAGSPLTIPHEDVFPAGSPDTLIPIQYSFADEVQGDTGIVSYYVAGYDGKDEEETEPSNMINIDLSTGQVNATPVAKLSVDTDYGGAPLTVTFDASGSTDSDGTIEEYRFDFDGDGVIDYSSDDAEPPAESSGGTVIDITPGASPWLVTATFTQYSADYYYASVKALDDDGALSLASYSKVGVTGWVNEVVTSDTVHTIEFYVRAMSFDPVTGELVLVGTYRGGLSGVTLDKGFYFARRLNGGAWVKEQIISFDAPEWHYEIDKTFGTTGECCIGWNTSGQPIVVMDACEDGMSPIFRIMCVERSATGEWNLVDGSNGGSSPAIFPRFSQLSGSPAAFRSPSDFAILYQDFQDYEGRCGLLWYKNGMWSIEDTGYKWELYYTFTNPAFDRNGVLHTIEMNSEETPFDVNLCTRNEAGAWSEDTIVSAGDSKGALGLGVHGINYTNTNELQFTLLRWFEESTEYPIELGFVKCKPSGLDETLVARIKQLSRILVNSDNRGISIFYDDKPSSDINKVLYHTRIEGTENINETICALLADGGDSGLYLLTTATSDDGRAYAYIDGFGGEYGQDWQLLAHRVYPRVE